MLDGTWRDVVEASELLAAGVDERTTYQNAAVWTFQIDGNDMVPIKEGQAPCSAEVYFAGDTLSVVFDEASGCGGDFSTRYKRAGDRITFSDPSGAEEGIVPFTESFFANGATLVSQSP